MTVVVTSAMQCDGEGCIAVGPQVKWAAKTTREARRAAIMAGWTHHGQNDYCPRCTVARRQRAALQGETTP